MDPSGQCINSTSNTSVSASSSADLSKPKSTSILNYTSVVKSTTARSTRTLSAPKLQTTISGTTTAPGIGVTSLSTNMNSTSFPQSDSSLATPPHSDSAKADLPSSTNSTSVIIASNTIETSVQDTSIGPVSTIVSVSVVRTTGGTTSTITTHPTSTLPKPVVSTSTNSSGSTLVITPPLITILSTSTKSDGSVVTTTSVVANAQHDQLASESGILGNPGAVAGIFSVVGVVFASLLVCMVFCIRRYRRIRRREKWLAGIRPQRPNSFADDPFHDDNIPPAMRSVDDNTEDAYWDRKNILTSTIAGGSSHNFGQANASVLPEMHPLSHNGTLNQPDNYQLRFIDIASSSEPNRAHFRRSWTPSTPSIYPVSLSPGEDEHVSDDIVPNLNRSSTTTSSLPPRPPRSHLRDRVKSLDFKLPTPPESESSSHPSPISESRFHDVHTLDRKTILDVRSRLITS